MPINDATHVPSSNSFNFWGSWWLSLLDLMGATGHCSCSGTVGSYNNHGGSQDFEGANIISGLNSGQQRGASNQVNASARDSAVRTNSPSHFSGTLSSFECHGGYQNYQNARIFSGENSGNGSGRGSLSRGSRSVLDQCAGTQNSSDCCTVSQRSKTKTINRSKSSGDCSGTKDKYNKPSNGSGSDATTSQQPGPSIMGNGCSGTEGSFNNYGKGLQNFTNARICSGENSGNARASGSGESRSSGTGTGTQSVVMGNSCSGTIASFNNNRGSQCFKGANIHSSSGENISSGTGIGTQSVARRNGSSGYGCSGTVGSFNNHRNGLQDFKGAMINSVHNLGQGRRASNPDNASGSAESRNRFSGTQFPFRSYGGSQITQNARVFSDGNPGNSYHSKQEAAIHCSGTLNSFNNCGNGSQKFSGAKINSGANSGDI